MSRCVRQLAVIMVSLTGRLQFRKLQAAAIMRTIDSFQACSRQAHDLPVHRFRDCFTCIATDGHFEQSLR